MFVDNIIYIRTKSVYFVSHTSSCFEFKKNIAISLLYILFVNKNETRVLFTQQLSRLNLTYKINNQILVNHSKCPSKLFNTYLKKKKKEDLDPLVPLTKTYLSSYLHSICPSIFPVLVFFWQVHFHIPLS